MWAGYQDGLGADALSVLDWWREAGVDALVDESPRDWLAPPPSPAPPAAAPPATPDANALPDTLAGLHAWLADTANLADLGPRRIAPAGDPATGLMIVADMPEIDERDRLFDGAAGTLFDAMLAAIGRTRDTVYLAPLCPARPAGGRASPTVAGEVAAVARAHVALVRPRALLLLGREAGAAFGLSAAAGRGALHRINHAAGTVAAVATHHPRVMLGRPACKADAWADLCALIEEFGG